jgi:hypothetical protein
MKHNKTIIDKNTGNPLYLLSNYAIPDSLDFRINSLRKEFIEAMENVQELGPSAYA